MNSLTAHLTAGTGHGRLRFHPDCPICRSQRLSGPTPAMAVSVRTQAGLLTAALAAGTVLPAPVAASTPNPQPAQSGDIPAVEPVQPEHGVEEADEAPTDEAPDLREVLTDPTAGSDDDGEDISAEEPDTEPLPPPAPETPVVAPEPPVPSTPVAVPEAPAPQAPAAPPAPPAAEAIPTQDIETVASPPREERWRPEARHLQRPRLRPAEPSPGTQTQSPSAERQPDAAVVASVSVPVAEEGAPPAGRISGSAYTVRPGDSLWSIAKRLLGPNATNGRVAGEVHRLWELNKERIATGDPNLLRIGTELRLR